GDVLGRLSPLVFSGLINRNLMGSTLTAGMFAAIMLFSSTRKDERLVRVLVGISTILLIYFIVISMSRSTIFTGLAAMLVLTISKAKTKTSRIILFVALSAGILMALDLPNYYDSLDLNQAENLEHFSSGRTDIWSAIIQNLPKTNFI